MRPATWPLAGAFAALLFAAAACAPEDIVAASTIVPVDASDEAHPGCMRNEDCADDQFCSKSACQDASGRCEKRPTLCDAAPSAACGCDGISYFNDCLRRASGVASSTPGECDANAVHCGGLDDGACPAEAYCAKLLPPGPHCPGDPRGTCWVLPSACGAEPPGGDLWSSCQGGGPDVCVPTCQAIRSEQPHVRAFRCP